MQPQEKRQRLGRKISVFRSRPIGFKTWLLLVVPAVILTLFCFAYGVLLAGNAFQQHGPALALLRARGWFVLGAVLFTALIIYLGILLLLSFQRVEVFSEGFRYRNSFLRQRSYLWSDLFGISSSATSSTIFGHHLRTLPTGKIYPKSGRAIDLSNRLEGVPKLIRIIKSNLYPILWPELKTVFLQGDYVQFGRISLNNNNLLIAKKKIPWISIKKLHVDSGFLVVEMYRDSKGKVPLSQILNLELLLKIVDIGFQT